MVFYSAYVQGCDCAYSVTNDRHANSGSHHNRLPRYNATDGKSRWVYACSDNASIFTDCCCAIPKLLGSVSPFGVGDGCLVFGCTNSDTAKLSANKIIILWLPRKLFQEGLSVDFLLHLVHHLYRYISI